MRTRLKLLKKIPHYWELVSKASKHYSQSRAITLYRFLFLKTKLGFTFLETYNYGFLSHQVSLTELPQKVISTQHLARLQEKLNPENSRNLLKNKITFYEHCVKNKLPAPRLYAAYTRNRPGWSPDERSLETKEEWLTFINQDLPHSFVIKPVFSYCGESITAFNRVANDSFTDTTGKPFSAHSIFQWMEDNSQFDAFIIQERITSHPLLEKLSATKNLQTIRLITVIPPDKACFLFPSKLRVIVGDNFVDNLNKGKTGNLAVEVSHQGTLGNATSRLVGELGTTELLEHPDSGMPFAGTQLPYWAEACELAKQAATAFLPLRNIGWDVALTPTGPCLIEGNEWHESPILGKDMSELLKTIQSAAAELKG